MPPNALAKSGLFHYEVPASHSGESRWAEFKEELLEHDPNWSYWTDWYDARLKGGPQSQAFEKALLTLTNEEWEKDPAEINAQLSALKKEFEREQTEAQSEPENTAPTIDDIPAQDRQGAIIIESDNGVLDLSDKALSGEFLDDPIVQSIIPNLKEAISVALEKISHNNLANFRLKEPIQNFQATLEKHEASLNSEISQVELWVKGNALRGHLRDEKSAFSNKDPDQPWLEQGYIQPFEQIVQLFNVLNSKTKRGDELDENSRNPEPRQEPSDITEAINNIADALREFPDQVTARVPDLINDLSTISNGDDAISAGARRTREKTTKNLLTALATKVLKYLAKIGPVISGVAVLGELGLFLSKLKYEIFAFLSYASASLLPVFQFILSVLGG